MAQCVKIINRSFQRAKPFFIIRLTGCFFLAKWLSDCLQIVTHPSFSILTWNALSFLYFPSLPVLNLWTLLLSGVHYRIFRQFLAAYWEAALELLFCSNHNDNWEELAGMLLFWPLSTLLLLDTAPLCNGIWMILNDPNALKFLGKRDNGILHFVLHYLDML